MTKPRKLEEKRGMKLEETEKYKRRKNRRRIKLTYSQT